MIGILRDAQAREPSAARARSLVRDLLWDRQFVEAERVARAANPDAQRDGLLVAAVMLAEGGQAAAREANGLDGGATRSATQILFSLREYDAARTLLSAIQPASTWIASVERLVRHDEPFKISTPGDAVIELTLEQAHPDRPRVGAWDAETSADMLVAQLPLPVELTQQVSVGMIDDMVRSLYTFSVEGDASAWRVVSELGGHRAIFYAAADRGTPKVIGDRAHLAGVGRYALRALAHGQLDAARRLLDWSIADAPPGWLASAWPRGGPRDLDTTRIAAAVLAAPTDAAHVLPIFEQCRSRILCDFMRVATLEQAKRYAEELELATGMLARGPALSDLGRRGLMIFRARALGRLGRFDDADQQLDEALAAFPGNEDVLAERFEAALVRTAWADAIKRSEPLVKLASPTPEMLNRVAWVLAFDGGDNAGATALIQKAVAAAPHDPAYLNTRAVIEVEGADLRAVGRDEVKVVGLRGDGPQPSDWYVMGRLYERLGLVDDAVAAYRRIKPDPDEHPSDFDFAARRLVALGLKP